MIDLQSLPAKGGTLLALVLYGGLSLLVTGPLVGERMIVKSGWLAQCPALIEADAQQRSTPLPQAAINCDAVVDLLAPEMRGLCSPLDDILVGIDQQRRDLEAQRLARATAGATSRCSCAAALVLEENRTALGLHVGALRQITPHGVKTLTYQLESALTAPSCTGWELRP